MVVLIGEWGFIVREHDNRVGFEVVVDLAHLDLAALFGHAAVDAGSRGDVHEYHRAVFPGHQVDGASALGLPVALDDLVVALDEELLCCLDRLILEFVHDGPPYVSAVRPFGLPPCEAKGARALPAVQGRKAKEALGMSAPSAVFRKVLPVMAFPSPGKSFRETSPALALRAGSVRQCAFKAGGEGASTGKEASIELGADNERACFDDEF